MPLKSFHVNITNQCNLNCSYCYFYEDHINVSNKEPEFDEITGYIDQAEEIGVKLVAISGGEPVLRPDIFDILNYGSTPKILLTNGTLLNEEVIRQFNSIPLLNDVKVSFDGFFGHNRNRGEGTSQQIIKNLKLLDELGTFPYSVATVITRENYQELPDIYDFVAKSKCYRWEIDFPLLRGRAKNPDSFFLEKETLYQEYIVSLVKQYIDDGFPFKLNIVGVLRAEFWYSHDKDFLVFNSNDHPCSYAMDSCMMHTSGDVSFCPSLSIVFGNINKNSLKEILASPKYMDFKALTVKEIKNCNNCRYLSLCGGGCRADALATSGDLKDSDPLSCERMLLFEKYILNILPVDIFKKCEALINKNGLAPLETL